MPEGLPEAPGAFADLSGLAETQGQAQDAVAGALGDATEQAQAAADAATQQAQQAYDQFWADYYTAVETTAQVYYDTMTATADYLLASYAAAVDYTTQTVDYYLAYAGQCYYCACIRGTATVTPMTLRPTVTTCRRCQRCAQRHDTWRCHRQCHRANQRTLGGGLQALVVCQPISLAR
ncbi:MAG: hypothetical protein IPK17_10140 [Chloroflexi bacterium]|uniref:hypothetical protein n=1 Tax=Candidatus Flexifilum breve TaxID=3140694 RepID=UPI00313657E8|nr:hypothetical protein [Chloroflexota bacterium]